MDLVAQGAKAQSKMGSQDSLPVTSSSEEGNSHALSFIWSV